MRLQVDSRDAEREAVRAGERFGRTFASSADRAASQSDLADRLAEDVERSSARVVRARATEVTATQRVLDADKALSAERTRGEGRTKALINAERQLDAALRRLSDAQAETAKATTEHGKTQAALQSASDRSSRSTSALSGALRKLQGDTNVDFSKLINGADGSRGAFDGLLGKLNLLGGAARGLGLILKPNIFAELIPVALGAAAAVAEVSGALLILPGVLTTAGLAMGAIKIATSGFGDALKNIGDPEKFAKSIEKLTPAARSAAIAVQGLKGRFDELRNSLQEKLFTGLDTEISQTGRVLLNVFQPAMESIARSSNTTVKSILQDFRSVREQSVFREIGVEGTRAFGNITRSILPLIQAFLIVASTGAKVFADITGGAGAATRRLAAFVAELKESGRLEEIMRRGIDALNQLGTVAKNVFSVISSFMRASGADGQTFLDRLVEITGKVAEFLKTVQGQIVLTTFFDLVSAIQVITAELKPLGPAVVATMRSITTALQTAAPFVTPLAASFADLVLAVQPLILIAGDVAAAVLGGITVVFRELRPIVETLTEAVTGFVTNALPGLKLGFGAALVATMPLLKALAELALVILPPLGTALGVIVTVLGPLLPLIIGAKIATLAWSAALVAAKATMVLLGPALSVLGFAFQVLTGNFAATAVAAKLHAASTAAAWVGARVVMVASAIGQGAVWLATVIGQFVAAAASAVVQAVATSAAWVAATAVMVADQVVKGAVFLAGWIATGVAAATSAVLQSGIAVVAWRAAGVAMAVASGPWGIAILGIAALAALVIANWDTVKTFFTTTLPDGVRAGIDAVVGFFLDLHNKILETVRPLIEAVLRFFLDLHDGIVSTVTSIVDGVIGFFSDLHNAVTGTVRGLVDGVTGFFLGLHDRILGIVRSVIDGVTGFFGGLPSRITGAIGDLGSHFYNIGIDIVNGIGRGIQAGWNYLTSLVSNLAGALFNAAKSALGIGSPSRVFTGIGDDLGLGLVKGIRGVTPEAVDAVKRMAAAVAGSARMSLDPDLTQVISQASVGTGRSRGPVSPGPGDAEAVARDVISIVQNIINPSVTDAIDSSNRELRRFAAMGGFTR